LPGGVLFHTPPPPPLPPPVCIYVRGVDPPLLRPPLGRENNIFLNIMNKQPKCFDRRVHSPSPDPLPSTNKFMKIIYLLIKCHLSKKKKITIWNPSLNINALNLGK
jgi:hypothetical protein